MSKIARGNEDPRYTSEDAQEDHKSSDSEEALSSDQESDNADEEEAEIHVNT